MLKGVLGFGFLAITLNYLLVLGWWALLPAVAALVCFRGCPMCWTFGLIETVIDRKSPVCIDGLCADRESMEPARGVNRKSQ
jgi:hypothetical protein